MKHFSNLLFFATILLSTSCQESITYDLAIDNVNLFDVDSGMVVEGQTILINGDRIAKITEYGTSFSAKEKIEGNGRLITPGFIDTHMHVSNIFGEYSESPEYLPKDSLPEYRQKVTDTYLKYGTTTLAEMGEPDKWMPVTLGWQKNPSPNHPDLLIAGGALISDEERIPYRGHEELANPEAAREKIREYAESGVNHLKLYWRLRAPEMEAVIDEANNLGLSIFGHIDENGMSIQQVMDMGVKHFEHMLATSMSVFTYDKDYAGMEKKYQMPVKMEGVGEYLGMRILQFKYIKETPELHEDMIQLLTKMAANGTSLSTTIHLLGSLVDKTYFKTTPETRVPDLTEGISRFSETLREDVVDGFDIMMDYLKLAHELGINIRIGTDCQDGGKALWSELLVLSQYGFSVSEALQIATINGALALNLEEELGSIAVGKKANLVIFEKDPFVQALNLISDKLVIKDGERYSQPK